MEKISCVMAGFPGTGKSSYLAALWAIEKEGNTGHLLVCKELPEDTTYLDSLYQQWIKRQELGRTTFAELPPISLTMYCKEQDRTIEVVLPDFMGEDYLKVMQGVERSNLKTWMESSDTAMVFLRISEDEYFQEEVNPDGVEPNKEKESIKFDFSKISSTSKSILLLRYLRDHMCLRKIAICISAIDEKKGRIDKRSIEKYVQQSMPAFYNFVNENFSQHAYFGISAQGGDYKKEDAKELMQRTRNGQRAYVYEQKINYDITRPLYYLVQS